VVRHAFFSWSRVRDGGIIGFSALPCDISGACVRRVAGDNDSE
jgi:hypothetical protein